METRNQAGQVAFVLCVALALLAAGLALTTDDEGRAGPSGEERYDACFRTPDGRWVCPRRDLVRLPTVEDGCEGVAWNLLDLPPELRSRNYAGGSCCHAAIQDVLKWHGFDAEAEWWRANKSGAYSVADGARVMDRLGLRFAYTTRGDERLLEWASRNGHGAAIHYYPAHAITFRGYANGHAWLCDNNRTRQLIKVPKAEFVRRWKGYGGCALSLVYSPSPPLAWR